MRKFSAGKLVVLAALLALTVTGLVAADDKDKVREEYTAFAVNMGGTGPAGATTFEITIDRWSTDVERAMLLTTLKEKGHNEFMKALRKQKDAGFLQGHGVAAAVNPFPSTRLHYAFESEEKGERHIVLVTDRYIGMREAMSNDRSMEYDTTVLMMQFPTTGDQKAQDKGKGLLYWAMKLGVDKKTGKISVEEWGNEPIRLTEITKTK